MAKKGHIDIIVGDDGNIFVDIDMPDGPDCDEVDAELRAILALLGVADPDMLDDLKKTPQPDGIPGKGRVKS